MNQKGANETANKRKEHERGNDWEMGSSVKGKQRERGSSGKGEAAGKGKQRERGSSGKGEAAGKGSSGKGETIVKTIENDRK
jgi:hypothetical protein